MRALFDTVKDCLRFVTECFDVIRQSAPHIYHSALPSAPQTSIVRKLYGQYISFPAPKVATDHTTSWRSGAQANHAIYSPDGQFIAVGLAESVKLYDPITLESPEVFSTTYTATSGSLSFSPDGCLLAYAYPR